MKVPAAPHTACLHKMESGQNPPSTLGRFCEQPVPVGTMPHTHQPPPISPETSNTEVRTDVPGFLHGVQARYPPCLLRLLHGGQVTR